MHAWTLEYTLGPMLPTFWGYHKRKKKSSCRFQNSKKTSSDAFQVFLENLRSWARFSLAGRHRQTVGTGTSGAGKATAKCHFRAQMSLQVKVFLICSHFTLLANPFSKFPLSERFSDLCVWFWVVPINLNGNERNTAWITAKTYSRVVGHINVWAEGSQHI